MVVTLLRQQRQESLLEEVEAGLLRQDLEKAVVVVVLPVSAVILLLLQLVLVVSLW
jgi:hypothetical protein